VLKPPRYYDNFLFIKNKKGNGNLFCANLSNFILKNTITIKKKWKKKKET
jgi:hypothetical protein